MKKCTITYKGRKIILNQRLIEQKGLDDETVNKIKELHKKAIDIDIILSNKFLMFLNRIGLFLNGIFFNEKTYLIDISFSDIKTIKYYLDQWTYIQIKLQLKWGFPIDGKYHKFWHLKSCTCSKIDNEDRYPSGYYVYSGDCPLHGGMLK